MPRSAVRQPAASQAARVEILRLLATVAEKFEPENGGTKEWIARHSANPALGELLQDTTLLALRVLDAVGRLEPVNGIGISKTARIPKGSVSKIARRLAAQKLVLPEARPNNKKEVLYRLTPLGRELFEAHQAFDKQMERGFMRFLKRYNADELAFLAQVLQDIGAASFLDEAGQ